MGAITYFPAFGEDERIADIQGSSFGEPDGSEHRVEVLEGRGHLIVRVTLQGIENSVDLLFTDGQAVGFGAGVQAVLRRLGLDK